MSLNVAGAEHRFEVFGRNGVGQKHRLLQQTLYKLLASASAQGE
jgi:hypothetical protein